jgi:hypothetical protein
MNFDFNAEKACLNESISDEVLIPFGTFKASRTIHPIKPVHADA